MWQVVSGIRDPFKGDCDLQVELRSEHLGASLPPCGDPTASERLAAAYAEALAAETG